MTSILLVDDDNTLRSLLADALASEGYNINQAENGKQALHHLDNTGPDDEMTNIVLTDLSMPVMDGLELITHLRDHYAKQFHIVAMTAGIEFSNKEDHDFVLLKAADAFGAGHTIEKPFRMSMLVDLLRQIAAP